MILLEHVNKTYHGRMVLRDLNFQVKKGGVTGFLGANGAGKTTTMDIICGCKGFDSGRVVIGGHDILQKPLAARKSLGYLPDIPPVYSQLKVREVLEFAAKLHALGNRETPKRINQVSEQLGLSKVLGQLAGTLSKGFRQRLGVAQAVIHRPRLLVFDEPAEGLDPVQLQELRSLIRRLGEESTVFLSSHLLGELQSLCDELVIIDQGKIVAQGSLVELSDALARRKVVRLRIRQNVSGFLKEIQGMDPDLRTDLTCEAKGEIKVSVNYRDSQTTLDRVVHRAVTGLYGLDSLEPEENLEDVFLNYTRNRQNSPGENESGTCL